jgi:integrase
MSWLPWPIIPKRLWPEVPFQPKRAITIEEHQLIIEREKNPERRNFYELCWHLGGSQTDIANLKAEDIDWANRRIAYTRQKTGSLAMIHFGDDIEAVLRRLSIVGPLFPYLQTVRCGDRATEFKQRCEGLGIKGVSLHSYRYAWAERAKQCGYPERFAQEALGHPPVQCAFPHTFSQYSDGERRARRERPCRLGPARHVRHAIRQ